MRIFHVKRAMMVYLGIGCKNPGRASTAHTSCGSWNACSANQHLLLTVTIHPTDWPWTRWSYQRVHAPESFAHHTMSYILFRNHSFCLKKKKHCNVIWQAFPLTSGDLPKIIGTKVAVFVLIMYGEEQEITEKYSLELSWNICLFSIHLKGIWWLAFIVPTPPPPAQGWNYLFIPAITMYPGTGENELQVCISSLERIPHTFKVKFRSRFTLKSCISALEVGNGS